MTNANEKRLYCGFADQPLSHKGMEQLRQLKTEISFPKAERYVTSGLKRAVETLRILYDKTPDAVIEELNEYNFGDFEMKNHDELKENPDYLRWIEGGEDVSCPNGESRKKFRERIGHGFRLVREMNVDRILVVCHGGVIASLMNTLFANRKNCYDEWLPQNGRGYSIEISGSAMSCKPL
jgi:alpha-ribazole phosphatase